MDVQGDYDPVDAAGFIKVNALRSAIQNSTGFHNLLNQYVCVIQRIQQGPVDYTY